MRDIIISIYGCLNGYFIDFDILRQLWSRVFQEIFFEWQHICFNGVIISLTVILFFGCLVSFWDSSQSLGRYVYFLEFHMTATI